MFRFTGFAAAPLFVMLMGGVAHAALTADQVWAGWKEAGTAAGLTVTAATELSDGGALTLTGISVAGAAATVTLSDMTLTEEEDGTVSISPAAEIKLAMPRDGGATSAMVTHEALEIVVSEGEVGLDYGFAADLLTLVYDSSAAAVSPADGTAAEPSTASGTASMAAVEGGFAHVPGENAIVGISLATDLFGYDLRSAQPSVPVNTSQTNETEDLTAEITLTLPKTLAVMSLNTPEAWGAAFREGMALVAEIGQGETRGTSVDENPFFPMDMTVVTAPGSTTLSVDAAGVVMDAQGDGAEFTLKSAMIPVPEVKVTSGPLTIGLTMPLIADAEAGAYRFALGLTEMVVNEEAWALIDAGKVLPRDPAVLNLDVGGKAKMDVFALAGAPGGAAAPPEPQSFDVRALSLSVAGAVLTGSGAFTFDNAAVAAGGAPVPVGKGEVALTGGNALLDGLIKAGVVTEEMAAGPRMMLGAFMTPSGGPDSLTSVIEAKADGQITVNGQRIQ